MQDYLTLEQFVEATGRNVRTIYKMRDAGTLATETINGRQYYFRSEVDKAKQVKPLSATDAKVQRLESYLIQFTNKMKLKFDEHSEQIKNLSDLTAEQATEIRRLKDNVDALETQVIFLEADRDNFKEQLDALRANPIQNTVAPATPTEPALPNTLLEAKQALIAQQHNVEQLEKAEDIKATKIKNDLALAKKEELSKINSQTKVSSTLKGQKQQEEEAARQVRLAHRRDLDELNRTYTVTQTQLEEMNHFLNVVLEPDGTLYFECEEIGGYSMLGGCHYHLTTNRELTHYIKKEYQHLYHLTKSGIVDLKDGHSSILDFVPTLHFVTGVPVGQPTQNPETRNNSHTINTPSVGNTTEAYPAAWYKFIEDHPQPYQHSHNPPDIDLSYTDWDTDTPAQVALSDAAMAVHQQEIDKWVRFRQEQGLL